MFVRSAVSNNTCDDKMHGMSNVDLMSLVIPNDLQARQVGMHFILRDRTRPRFSRVERVEVWLALTSLLSHFISARVHRLIVVFPEP